MIIVGHNPSEKAWELGHYYGNPTNKMWKLLSTAGIVPPGFTASNDDDCPITSGVGFTDVVCTTVHLACTLATTLSSGGNVPQLRVVMIYFPETYVLEEERLSGYIQYGRACLLF